MVLAVWLCGWPLAHPMPGATPFHVDTFASGTLEGWGGGSSPTNIPTGGPSGGGDAFLQLVSHGLAGPGSRMAAFNDDPDWIGDYATAGVQAITVDFMNPVASTPLDMRLVLMDFAFFTEWTSTNAVSVPNDGQWHSYQFSVAESELTQVDGSAPYSTAIANVSRVMFRHNSGPPSTFGTVVAATLGIDNPRVVPTIDCQVFNDLVAAVAAGTNDPLWDLNRDGLVNIADLDTLRTIGGLVNLPSGNPYLPGDANLDGSVDGSDYNSWNSHKFTATAAWCSGDFNADGFVDGSDYNSWNSHKFTSSDAASPVPEPIAGLAVSLMAIFLWLRRGLGINRRAMAGTVRRSTGAMCRQLSGHVPCSRVVPASGRGSIMLALCMILMPVTAIAGGPRVAIVAAATNTANPQTNPRFTDPRDMLVADGRFSQVDIINTTPYGGGGTPTLATLMQYDAVLHWTNDSNADSISLGNVMADYVDTGGGVVVAVFANTSLNSQRYLQGRWLAEDYEIIPSQGGHLEGPLPGTPGSSGHVHMSTILDPTHPIFDLVSDVRLNWTTSTSGLRFGAHRPVTTSIHPWADKLALWEDGKTAVAAHQNYARRIDLGIHPVSDLVNAGYYDRTSDAGRLIANALFYSATVATITGDFNGDGLYDCADINALNQAVVANGSVAVFDLNGDGQLTINDVESWLVVAGEATLGPGRAYLVGDADLDGFVDGSDYNTWNSGKFTANANWCDGDFTADGYIDGSDFNRWNTNKFQSADAQVVPEPAIGCWLVTIGLCCRRTATCRHVRGGSPRPPQTLRLPGEAFHSIDGGGDLC